ncbi:DUF4845 domain-containing protein [Dechloromonas hortensis]|uniref:DUF4845 domain-containing protein n=1 Tax=Dechloromonas hortensis TaxID=337779 RepID=UPI0012912B8A|nr:DUF4845 domain-containing protein [Dechloromonas hortensis]
MKHQRGVALSGLLFWSVVLFFFSIVGIKIAPTVIEYYKIKKDCKAVVAQIGKDATVADVKKSFDRFADIDSLDFKSDQLDISKENGQIVISFAYEKRIPLFANVSLVIEYQGSTLER